MVRSASHHASDEAGQTLVEYAMILMLVVIVTVGGLQIIGDTVSDFIADAAAGFGG